MTWDDSNVYDYSNQTLHAPDGTRYKWYTDGSSKLILRREGLFGLVELDTYQITELLEVLNRRQLKPQ